MTIAIHDMSTSLQTKAGPLESDASLGITVVTLNISNPAATNWNLAFVHLSDDNAFDQLCSQQKQNQVLIRFSTAQLPPRRYPVPKGVAVNCVKKLDMGFDSNLLKRIAAAVSAMQQAGALSADSQLWSDVSDLIPLYIPHSLQALEILLQLAEQRLSTTQKACLDTTAIFLNFTALDEAEAANIKPTVETIFTALLGIQPPTVNCQSRSKLRSHLGICQ